MSIAVSHRPDPDELAAFIDGQLSGEERHKLEVHLGACEACREIVAESLLLLEDVPEESSESEPEVARVLTHPAWHRTVWRLAPLAAAALLVLVLWPTLVAMGGPATSRELFASFADPQGLGTSLAEHWPDQEWSTYRGSGSYENRDEDQIAFRLGVRLVDLQVALKTGNRGKTVEFLHDLIRLLEEGDTLEWMGLSYRGVLAQIEAEGEPEAETLQPDDQAKQVLMKAEDDLEEILQESQLEFDYFLLGRWVAAGRFAAMAGDQAYFEKGRIRRDFRKLERAELKPETAKELRHVREIIDGPDESGLEELRKALDKVTDAAG